MAVGDVDVEEIRSRFDALEIGLQAPEIGRPQRHFRHHSIGGKPLEPIGGGASEGRAHGGEISELRKPAIAAETSAA